MPSDLVVRFRSEGATLEIPADLVALGTQARPAAEAASRSPEGPVKLLLTGDRDYFVAVKGDLPAQAKKALAEQVGRSVLVVFPLRSPVRRRLASALALERGGPAAPPPAAAIDLTDGRTGAEPLWLLPNGRFSSSPSGSSGVDEAALVAAARWISSRRTTTFERLFAPSAFRPDQPARTERLSAAQAPELLAQVNEALAFAAVNGDVAKEDMNRAAQIRSASATILSHTIATALNDTSFRGAADAAAQRMFALIDAEKGDAARPMLRAHAIQLLQMRAPALSQADADKTKALVQSLVRAAPPYDQIRGPWRFVMASAGEFHDGECDILVTIYRFT